MKHSSTHLLWVRCKVSILSCSQSVKIPTVTLRLCVKEFVCVCLCACVSPSDQTRTVEKSQININAGFYGGIWQITLPDYGLNRHLVGCVSKLAHLRDPVLIAFISNTQMVQSPSSISALTLMFKNKSAGDKFKGKFWINEQKKTTGFKILTLGSIYGRFRREMKSLYSNYIEVRDMWAAKCCKTPHPHLFLHMGYRVCGHYLLWQYGLPTEHII